MSKTLTRNDHLIVPSNFSFQGLDEKKTDEKCGQGVLIGSWIIFVCTKQYVPETGLGHLKKHALLGRKYGPQHLGGDTLDESMGHRQIERTNFGRDMGHRKMETDVGTGPRRNWTNKLDRLSLGHRYSTLENAIIGCVVNLKRSIGLLVTDLWRQTLIRL